MKFFIDENLPPLLAKPISTLFRQHTFRTFKDENLGGTKDIPLFDELRSRRFDAIITNDAKQVVYNEPERRSLHENGLHWVGLSRPATSGLHLIAAWTAGVTAALPHILDSLADPRSGPTWFAVIGIQIESRQRMRSGSLWRDAWGKEPSRPRDQPGLQH